VIVAPSGSAYEYGKFMILRSKRRSRAASSYMRRAVVRRKTFV